ncbi:MAG: carboxypeptidase-like regulatory domain-containing protein [Candidatus Paceibacterota bacterium]|jgi:hypothetical protein
MKILKSVVILFVFIFIGHLMSVSFALASNNDGVIDSTYKYAWGENIGWINFGTSNGNVHVTDAGLSGYALGENIGWINLDNVLNNGEGTLSGYAWGENIGWIKFNPTNGGVFISSSGEFSGSALSENVGWIIFGGDYKVKTDWRPISVRPACNNTLDDDNDGTIDYPNDPGCSSLEDTTEGTSNSGSGGMIAGTSSNFPITTANNTIAETIKEIPNNIIETIKEIPNFLDQFVPEFLKPNAPEVETPEIPIEEAVKQETPLSFQNKWNLLSKKQVDTFVLAPLPDEIRKLIEKFPELAETFKKIGITKITDVEKLRAINLTLPGLTERIGLPNTEITFGNFVLPAGVPLAKLTTEIKKQIPSEIIFAKTGGQLIDFDIALSINEEGRPQQKITTIVGKPLQLVVKPDKPVKSVKGYVVFKSTKTTEISSTDFSFISLTQLVKSKLFASPIMAYPQEKPVQIEEKLVLLEFEYTDPDGDGLYTAEINSSLVEGEYEIITVMEFEDPLLGKKEIRLITVVDPEGYIYTNSTLGKVRIERATASIYYLNSKNKQYELWPASEYSQENPQITDDTGKYSFLVPPGSYYITVEHPDYVSYQSEIFTVKEGSGVHMNIELNPKFGWLRNIDWKVIVLICFGILLLYNFYRDKIREKLFKKT